MRKLTFWFPTRSDTIKALQIQKMARGLKFRIYKVEGLYYLCSENKGADQLRSNREADLRLCFRKCKNGCLTWLKYLHWSKQVEPKLLVSHRHEAKCSIFILLEFFTESRFSHTVIIEVAAMFLLNI